MKQLYEFVEQIRQDFPSNYVPNFDANDGGINASILFLFEKPGPMTDKKNGGSGLISQDNNDDTARSTKLFLKQAGIDRKKIVLWNALPSWNGTIKITAKERRHNTENTLIKLLEILTKIRTIILVGKEAEKLVRNLDLTNYKVIHSMHPSPRNRASRRKDWDQIPIVWAKALL